eukprot:1916070-Amphidinium_carterae.1
MCAAWFGFEAVELPGGMQSQHLNSQANVIERKSYSEMETCLRHIVEHIDNISFAHMVARDFRVSLEYDRW